MKIILSLACLSFFLSSTALALQALYKQEKQTDGSIVTQYESAGAKVRQIQRSDGTIETDALDSEGNETITTQHPNGKIEVKTKRK